MTPSAPPIGSMSPSSSPRLPSPPPFPELQLGPKSPGINATPGGAVPENEDTTKLDQGAMRRIRPGTKAADFAGPPLIPLSDLDSPFQLQEHLKALHYHHTHSPDTDHPKTTKPITRESATEIANPPSSVDRNLWLYELCRLLVMKANVVCVCFFREDPPCSAATCPEMRASEWQYLCAVHEPPKSCCAIDYCCHTLEWAADTLTSTKNFPSRLQLGGDAPGAVQGAVRQLTNIMRRVYRIFAHAWFSHREVFWQLENDEGLYVLFKTVCDEYHLIPEENYTVPPEAEGFAAKEDDKSEQKSTPRKDEAKAPTDDAEDKTTMSTGATTRRHKHTPSMGSTVTTIQEGEEDESSAATPVSEEGDALSTAMERTSLNEAPLAKSAATIEKKDTMIPVLPEPHAKSTTDLEPTPAPPSESSETKAAEAPAATKPAEETTDNEEEEAQRPSTAVKEPSSESVNPTIKVDSPSKTESGPTFSSPEKI